MIIQTANNVNGTEKIVKYQSSNPNYNPIQQSDDYEPEVQSLHSNSFIEINNTNKSESIISHVSTKNDNYSTNNSNIPQQMSSQNLLFNESKHLLLTSPELLELAIYSEPVENVINLHRWTLFLTLFISILQGSLLSYTCGCTLFGVALPPLLYFIRIFSDLLGRPLALLPKPSFFQSIKGVFIGSIIRVIGSFYFFYIIHTISPHESLLKNTFEQSFSLCVFQVFLKQSHLFIE